MANQIRKYHGDKFKFKVALAALKGDKTIAELCQEYGVVSSQICAWKKQLEKHGSTVFSDKRKSNSHNGDVDKLHATIGKLKVENDFLARVLGR